MALDSRVRTYALRLGALGIGLALIFGTWWGALLAFLGLGVLALVAWMPWLGHRTLARVGWTSIPIVGGLVGLKASGVLAGGAVAALVAGAFFAPPAPSRAVAAPTSAVVSLSQSSSVASATVAAGSPNPTASLQIAGLVSFAASPTTPPSPTPSNAIPTPTTAPPTTAVASPPAATTAPPTAPPPTAPPTTAPAVAANLVITQLNYDGAVARTESDEYVQIVNRGGVGQNMAGWKIVSVRAGQTYSFPNVSIAAGQTCRVYTNEIHSEWCGLSWAHSTAIWNNVGDRANLVDPSGRVVSTSGYGGY